MSAQPIRGTVRGPDGRLGIFDGDITYPETTLAPVRPWLILFDTEFAALAPEGTKSAVTGPDKEIQRVCGFTLPVNGGDRDYLTFDGFIRGRAVEDATRTALGVQRSLVCLWPIPGSTSVRYGNALMRSILGGEHDEQARVVVRSVIPDGQTYIALLHEADGYGTQNGNNLDPSLYRMALLHLLRVMIEEAQYLELTPNQFGVGGLLTGTGMGDSLRWRWWDGMPQDLIDSNMVVCYWDTYWQAGQVDSFAGRIATQSAAPRAAGLTRFVVAETTKVGPEADQVGYIKAATQCLRDGLLEGVAFFYKPDGEMSGPGPLRGKALQEFGWRAKEMNRG